MKSNFSIFHHFSDFHALGGARFPHTCFLLKKEKYNLVLLRSTKEGSISVRHNIKGFNAGNMLSKMGIGGGHANSAGIQAGDFNNQIVKIKELENSLYELYPQIRR